MAVDSIEGSNGHLMKIGNTDVIHSVFDAADSEYECDFGLIRPRSVCVSNTGGIYMADRHCVYRIEGAHKRPINLKRFLWEYDTKTDKAALRAIQSIAPQFYQVIQNTKQTNDQLDRMIRDVMGYLVYNDKAPYCRHSDVVHLLIFLGSIEDESLLPLRHILMDRFARLYQESKLSNKRKLDDLVRRVGEMTKRYPSDTSQWMADYIAHCLDPSANRAPSIDRKLLSPALILASANGEEQIGYEQTPLENGDKPNDPLRGVMKFSRSSSKSIEGKIRSELVTEKTPQQDSFRLINMKYSLWDLYHDRASSDIVLLIDGVSFYCHKTVLGSASKLFSDLFIENDIKEYQFKTEKIPGFIWECMIAQFYGILNHRNMTKYEASDLLKCFAEYGADSAIEFWRRRYFMVSGQISESAHDSSVEKETNPSKQDVADVDYFIEQALLFTGSDRKMDQIFIEYVLARRSLFISRQVMSKIPGIVARGVLLSLVKDKDNSRRDDK